MKRLDVFCFVSVARTLSFSQTAKELMITQQAVSRHIRNLEEEIGYPLFHRDYQNVVLTKAGEKMLEYFINREHILDEFNAHSQILLKDNTLKIAWSQWYPCPEWFSSIIKKFLSKNPDVKLLCYNLNAREMKEAMESEGIDFILTTSHAAKFLPIKWKQQVLREEPIVLIENSERRNNEEHILWAVDTGESNDETVRMREKELCEKLGTYFSQIRVVPDMGSVYLNILASGGFAYGIHLSELTRNDDFLLVPTDKSATIVLCSAFQQFKESAIRFAEFIQKELEDIQ